MVLFRLPILASCSETRGTMSCTEIDVSCAVSVMSIFRSIASAQQSHDQFRQEGEETGTNYRGLAVRKAAWRSAMLHMILSFPVLSLLSTAQINSSRPSPSHSAIENHSFGFSVKVFSRSALPKTCLEVIAVQTNLIPILVYALYLKLRTDRLTY